MVDAIDLDEGLEGCEAGAAIGPVDADKLARGVERKRKELEARSRDQGAARSEAAQDSDDDSYNFAEPGLMGIESAARPVGMLSLYPARKSRRVSPIHYAFYSSLAAAALIWGSMQVAEGYYAYVGGGVPQIVAEAPSVSAEDLAAIAPAAGGVPAQPGQTVTVISDADDAATIYWIEVPPAQ